jgi:hypothetical protein
VDVCEYRLGKLEKNIQTRLDAMEQAVKASARSRYGMGAVSNEETAALDKLSRHARSVYFQFEDREKGAKGKPTV